MTSENPSPPSPSTGERLGRALLALLRFVVRVLLVFVLAILLGMAVYFGVPALYQRYVQPVETSLSRLDDAQARQEQVNQQLNQRLDDLQSHLEELELQNDSHKQNLDDLGTRLGSLEEAASPQDLVQIKTRLDKMETALQATSANLDQLNKDIAAIDQAIAQTSAQVQDLTNQAATGKTPLQAFRTDLQLLKAMQLLTRSRISMAESNLGLAEEDVRAARLLLASIAGDVPPYQVETLSAIVARLDAALSNLPPRPILAAEDLEAAWQLLRSGLPGEPTPGPTPTQTTATPTPLPTP